MKNKSKNKVDGKAATEQLIISEQSKSSTMEKPPVDKKKLAALEKERLKQEKKLQEKMKKGEFLAVVKLYSK